jgi:uncharacterized membrane protein
MEKPALAERGPRIDSIDLLRGIVIALMALDHVRDFFSMSPYRPEDLSQASLGLFYTRLFTHFCAPTFVLLAGTGAALYARARPGQAAPFLLERGLLLILLELTVVNLSWPWIYGDGFIFVQVIWVLGISMVLLGLLVHLEASRALLLALGLLLVFGHNLLDGIETKELGSFGPFWGILHDSGIWPLGGGFTFLIVYPLLPWPGVMILGYLLGELFADRSPEGAEKRKRFLLLAGAGALLLFVALRFFGLYGEPQPWQTNPRGVAFTVAEFFNTTKYPPSLQFLLMTLGPALLLLPFLERWQGRIADFFLDFGRAPLFFYLLHFPLLHLAEIAWSKSVHGVTNLILLNPDHWPPSYSQSLPRAYLVWLGTLFLMRPLCRAFVALKRRRPESWLRYF